MKNNCRFAWVDAFTPQPFSGNPAAVCLLESPISDGSMQSLAAEFGLSETAFVVAEAEKWSLRWFTPAAEVRLCGHATVATATALWEFGVEQEELVFSTLSGDLTAKKCGSKVQLNFPSRPPQACALPNGLLAAVGLTTDHALWCGRDKDDYMVRLNDEETLLGLKPNFLELAKLQTRGVIFTTEAERDEIDFVSRFFAPRVGVDEDPVTGSAHCCLAPYWSQQLGKSKLKAHQRSRRGGELELELVGDRVTLRGESYLLVKGEVRLPQ